MSTGAPRTIMEALVQERRWSHQDFCREYTAAAKNLGMVLSVSPQHVSRWLAGKLKGLPYPTQCRVLEHLFGVSVVQLFTPARPRQESGIDKASGRPTRASSRSEGVVGNQDEEISMAADESARFAEWAEQTNVGPHTLEQFAADIRRIVTVYPNRPVYPLFIEVRSLRDRAFEKLEGRQFPNQSRDLYMIAGILNGVLANASFDLGRLDAAETQARTAFLCAELAGSNWLRAWIRGTQALVAYWDDRPLAAVRLAEDGTKYDAESGTATVRLASIQARAHGMLRDVRGVEDALNRATQARDGVRQDDEIGGMMAFPAPKQRFYAATAYLWLGERGAVKRAAEHASHAVAEYEAAAPESRRLGELNLARLDLAAAHLGLSDLEGVADAVRPVLEVAQRRPIDSVVRRLSQLDAAIAQPGLAGNSRAAAIRDEIRSIIVPSARPALPAIIEE